MTDRENEPGNDSWQERREDRTRLHGGYESYQYLEEGSDYRSFEFPESWHCGEPYEVPLPAGEDERARRLAAENTVVSIHDHPVYYPADIPAGHDAYTNQGRMWTAYDALAESPLDAVFDNVGLTAPTSKAGLKWTDVVHELGLRAADIAQQDLLVQAETTADIRTAHRENRVAWIPGIETCSIVENELDRIEVLYGLGIRTLGITYSEANAMGTGLSEKRDGGLTNLGHEAVDRLNKVGMAIGLSHASNQTTLDVCEASDDPVFLSHNGAQALLDIDRLDPDECLKACAETGGVIGIQAAPHTTVTPENGVHTIETVMEHFEYVRELVGIDHVTLGPDGIYGDHRALHKAFGSSVPDGIDEVAFVEGMENPTEAWHNFVRWLVKEGYTDEEIEKVTGGNVLRALETIWD
jgi:membrane dipeptidase